MLICLSFGMRHKCEELRKIIKDCQKSFCLLDKFPIFNKPQAPSLIMQNKEYGNPFLQPFNFNLSALNGLTIS